MLGFILFFRSLNKWSTNKCGAVSPCVNYILLYYIRPDKSSCKAANEYFQGPGYVEDRKCDEVNYPDICHFLKEVNGSRYKLSCDKKVCGGNTLTIGSINKEQGIITNWEVVQPFSVDKVLEYVKRNAAAGFDFCFMKCGSIFQALVFPPVVKAKNIVSKQNKININIVVLDSIARQHFYRTMPKSVAALRKITYDESIPATALDFELFQAISQHTFDNIRPLFSGIVRGKSNNYFIGSLSFQLFFHFLQGILFAIILP